MYSSNAEAEFNSVPMPSGRADRCGGADVGYLTIRFCVCNKRRISHWHLPKPSAVGKVAPNLSIL